MTRYYEHEHVEGYARIRRDGLDQWNDLHPADSGHGYERFAARPFLERVLRLPLDGMTVFEYGCGTGGAACWLAARGALVTAMDLVPDAIAVARERAAQRGLDVAFTVGDVCAGDAPDVSVDLVLDCFCLQSVVMDEDRSALFRAVRERLAPSGRYLVATAMAGPDRTYGADIRDEETGIVWSPSDAPSDVERRIDGVRHVPTRRHLTAFALRRELGVHGFEVVEQSGALGGELVCRRRR